MLELINAQVDSYCQSLAAHSSKLTGELYQYTYEQVHGAQMLSGPQVGRLLQILLLSSKSTRVLEFGTYTGYSALTMAEALPENGQLVTIEVNAKMAQLAQSWFARSPAGAKINSLVGDVKTVVPKLTGKFDFFFIDADKKPILDYYQLALDWAAPGALIVIDNALRQGQVFEPESKHGALIAHANDYIAQDPRVVNLLLPVRDGVHLAWKLDHL